MKQIVDLENDSAFQDLNVAVVSIAFDSQAEMAQGKQEYGISSTPLLTDTDHSVSEAYDVLQWAVASGEPSHTFVLVNKEGKIVWVRDYGSPDKADQVMYVPVPDLVSQVRDNLNN